MPRRFKGKSLPFLAGLIVLVATSCATAPINWDARIGQFSYDDAVGELGKPAKVKTRPDGKTEAVWISFSSATSADMDSGFYQHSAGLIGTEPEARESQLRLTFTTNNILTDWSKD